MHPQDKYFTLLHTILSFHRPQKTAKSMLKNDYERKYPQNNQSDQHAVQFLSTTPDVAITQGE